LNDIGLTQRTAFHVGRALVAPATRKIRGPGGGATIEPRVMQVLLALVDAQGAVVTREQLLQTCWNGVFVGDDALNRAVAEVRRLARTVAAGSFAVETIPRTGYRLATTEAIHAAETEGDLPRRRMLWTGGALALIAGGAAWSLWPNADAARARELADEARVAANTDMPEGYQRAVALLREAVALQPTNAWLWGRLAIAWCAAAEYVSPSRTHEAVEGCELAAARALALDPKQADARTALALLRPRYGDWLSVEGKLMAVLTDAPTQGEAIDALGLLRQAVGRSREAVELGGRVVAQEPLGPVRQYRRAYQLWSTGRLAEADRVIQRATELWPAHPGVWLARLYLMAFTGRTRPALAQLADRESWPPRMPDETIEVLRASVQALDSRQPSAVDKVVSLHLAEAMKGPSGAIMGILFLNAFGRLDEAFTVAEGYLLRRGARIMPLNRTRTQAIIGDQRQRKTMSLFIPVSAPMRADPRFADLCRGCGLVDYWRESGRWPDFLGNRRL
jgi:DNA-binding winged helix-turn-helix (wHTH) protein/Flp pilus assembly protein TadD